MFWEAHKLVHYHRASSHAWNSAHTGSAITLQLRTSEAGVRCSPRCRAKRCQGNQASCHGPAYQFDIIAVDGNATKITSGSKVALRSRCNMEKWLDCTGIRNTCLISRCLRCTGDRCGNYDDHTSSCDHHHFTILAVGRREGRLINSNYPIQLVREGLVLTCSDAQCHLSNGDVAEEREGEENSYSLTILFWETPHSVTFWHLEERNKLVHTIIILFFYRWFPQYHTSLLIDLNVIYAPHWIVPLYHVYMHVHVRTCKLLMIYVCVLNNFRLKSAY